VVEDRAFVTPVTIHNHSETIGHFKFQCNAGEPLKDREDAERNVTNRIEPILTLSEELRAALPTPRGWPMHRLVMSIMQMGMGEDHDAGAQMCFTETPLSTAIDTATLWVEWALTPKGWSQPLLGVG